MKRILIGTVGVALAMSAAACSPGDSDEGSGDEKGDIVIAYLGILSGPNAVESAPNGFELAIKEINDAGGIDGRKLKGKKYDTDITPEGAARATNLALRDEPVALLGFPVSSGLKASIGSIKPTGIPVIHDTLGSLTTPDSLGYDRTFRFSPTTSQYAKAGNAYLIDTLGAKAITVIHTEDASPTEGAESIAKDAKAKGVSIVERAVAPGVTDLTEPILAARKTDAIWEWGYAPDGALAVKQMAQNDVNVPIMTFSIGQSILAGLVPKELATDELLQVSNCMALVSDDEKAKNYLEAYTSTYKGNPFEPRNYDEVYLLKAAIEKAGSTDGEAIADALATITYEGVCGSIRADENHNLMRNVPILSWEGGTPKLAKLEEDIVSEF